MQQDSVRLLFFESFRPTTKQQQSDERLNALSATIHTNVSDSASAHNKVFPCDNNGQFIGKRATEKRLGR